MKSPPPTDMELRGGPSDPSSLTSQLVQRELMHLRELVMCKIDAAEEANRLVYNDLKAVPADTARQVDHLRSLVFQQFGEVAQRFVAREEYTKLQMERLEQRFLDAARFNQTVSDASKAAVEKAEVAQRETNEKNNEFRGQLADQAATLMPRKEAEQANGSLRELMDRELAAVRFDVTTLRDARAIMQGQGEGKTDQQNHLTWIIGIFLALLTVGGVLVSIALYLKK